jgi:hypothetical protein
MIKGVEYGKKRLIPLAAPPKAWFCGRSLAGDAGSNPARGQGSLCVVSVVCQVEVPASGLLCVQGSPTECGVSECDREVSIMRPWPHWGLLHHGRENDRKRSQPNCDSVLESDC